MTVYKHTVYNIEREKWEVKGHSPLYISRWRRKSIVYNVDVEGQDQTIDCRLFPLGESLRSSDRQVEERERHSERMVIIQDRERERESKAAHMQSAETAAATAAAAAGEQRQVGNGSITGSSHWRSAKQLASAKIMPDKIIEN